MVSHTTDESFITNLIFGKKQKGEHARAKGNNDCASSSIRQNAESATKMTLTFVHVFAVILPKLFFLSLHQPATEQRYGFDALP